MIEPTLVEKPSFQIIGPEASFIGALSTHPTNFKVIPALWESFCVRVGEVPNRLGQEMYGVMYGRPRAERGDPDEMQYIAAVRVSSNAQIPSGMVSHTIPAAMFAVFIHRGPISGIAETVSQIYRQWLPNSKYKHAGIADVELYDQRFNPTSEKSEMEYWISVSPK